MISSSSFRPPILVWTTPQAIAVALGRFHGMHGSEAMEAAQGLGSGSLPSSPDYVATTPRLGKRWQSPKLRAALQPPYTAQIAKGAFASSQALRSRQTRSCDK